MSELTPLVNYDPSHNTEINLNALTPIEGKIKINPHRPDIDAVYFADDTGAVIAYATYKPYWESSTVVEVESFTNETHRKKGLQNRLNEKLVTLLKSRGVNTIVGQIQSDNSVSFLNRLTMTDPDTQKTLKATIDDIDELSSQQSLVPSTLTVKVHLDQIVDSNQILIDKVRLLQQKLTINRYGTTLEDFLLK